MKPSSFLLRLPNLKVHYDSGPYDNMRYFSEQDEEL